MSMKSNDHSAKSRIKVTAVVLSLLTFFWLSAWALEIPTLPSSATETLRERAKFLASDELTGRGVGTPGIKLARDYIAREFARDGLLPGGDNGTYFQSFEAATGVTVKQPSSLTLGRDESLTLNENWTPLGLSASGKVEGEVIFAGYGVSAKDYGYDDYAGIDAKGKVVIVLRYEPPPKDDKSPFQKWPRYSTYATLRAKANNARDHGAVGMILVDLQRARRGGPELISTRNSFSRLDNGVVSAQIRGEIIEKWLQVHGVVVTELKEKIDREEKRASIPLTNLKMSLAVTLELTHQRAENVVGILPGSDPKLRNQNIVIGAHYDHLGL